MARRGRKAGAWLVLGLAGPLLALGLLSFARRIDASWPLTGVEWVQSGAGPVAMTVEPDSPAGRSGMHVGDILLRADGRRVDSALDAAELAWDTEADGHIRIVVRRGGSERELVVRPRWQARSEPYAYLSIVALAFWASGAFIALRWPLIRGGNSYSFLSLAMFAHLILSPTGDASPVDRWIDWLDLVAGALVPALLLHFGVVLSRRALRWPRVIVAAGYLAAAGIVAVSVWVRPDALGGGYRFHDPVLAVEAVERLSPVLLALAWLVTTGLLVRSWARSASVLHRSQVRWLLWGLALGLGPFVVLYAVPWSVGAAKLPDWAEFLAVAPMVLVPGAFTAALARYRLHDLDLILLRGITEVTAVFATFAVLAGAVFVLREGVAELLPLSHSASRYLGFLVAAVSYPQIRSWTRIVVERAFYRRRYSYRATLLDWARQLNAETDLDSLAERLRGRIGDTVGVPHAEVLLRAGTSRFRALGRDVERVEIELGPAAIDRLEQDGHVAVEPGSLAAAPWVEHLFPMLVKGDLRAVLAVAERGRSEEPLSSEDRALLGTLAAHAATAIEAARLYQEVRRRADEIERLHARQAAILESSAVGLLLLDGDGRIQAWNRALEAIYGLGRDDAIGRKLGDVLPLHVARRIERESESATVGEARVFRLGLVNRDGDRRLVNMAVSAAGTETADSRARVVTFDDVTERAKLEEQVLRQERLASLGLLAAGVAHEINTPLTGISSYTQMLLDDGSPAEQARQRQILQKIEAQTQRAARITTSLLNLARPERTQLELLDLNSVVHEVLQLFEPQVRRSGIHLRTGFADDLPAVRGHRGKLQQVVLNLLINARDALGESGNITIHTYRSAGKAVIEIADDGSGISEEDLPRIFDPFFTTKGRGKGTGLGLSISYGIVQEHDGQIEVDSSHGQYTKFRVELPAFDSARAMA